MIFTGVINVLDVNTEITYTYPDKFAGLKKESYKLRKMDENTTCVAMTQDYSSEEAGKGSEDG